MHKIDYHRALAWTLLAAVGVWTLAGGWRVPIWLLAYWGLLPW